MHTCAPHQSALIRRSRTVTHKVHSRKGHERAETTARFYLHADMSIRERALARTNPLNTKPGRYRPPDQLLAFLDNL